MFASRGVVTSVRGFAAWMSLAVLGSCANEEAVGVSPDQGAIALTPTEYNRSIRDLLGMPEEGSDWPKAPAVLERLAPTMGQQAGLFGFIPQQPDPWPWELPDEIGVDDFEGMVEGQSSSSYQLEELQKAAIHYGAYTLVSPTFFTCSGWRDLEPEPQADCAWQSLARFAQLAWRRPLTTPERNRLQAYWELNLGEGSTEEAVALTAAGILQAPAFLFRVEEGQAVEGEPGRSQLTGWEVASRLSYLLWDSMPDAELFAAAERGDLDRKNGIEAQVLRMWADPKAREAVVHFHHQWLGTDDVHHVSPARHVYGPVFGISPYSPLDTTGDEVWPGILGPVRHSMEAETYLFIVSTLFEGEGTLQALLTDHHGYLSTQTEPIYGDGFTALDLDPVSWKADYIAASLSSVQVLTMRPVTFRADERAGLLTMPSVLALGAHPVHPSPILRGKRILERVTCTTIGAPPPGAEAAAPPDTEDADSTNRERTEAVTASSGCAGCHDVLNPPGFAFEAYDSLGRMRDTDNGQPVDTTGSFLLGGETLTFTDGVDLSHQLAVHGQVRDCYAQRWTDYALGATLDPTDPEVARILSSFRDQDHVRDLIVSITTSDLFRFRASGEGS